MKIDNTCLKVTIDVNGSDVLVDTDKRIQRRKNLQYSGNNKVWKEMNNHNVK